MLYNEAFDYLWNQLANGKDSAACAERLKDYQRKRLRRALLGRAIKPYYLEASWISAASAGPDVFSTTVSTTAPLLVLDGAIRSGAGNTAAGWPNANSFALQILRSGGDARVQILQDFIKDEHLVTPNQCAIRTSAGAGAFLGQGALWPLTWPVPVRLLPNELLQIKARPLPGAAAFGIVGSYIQFRAVMVDNQKEDDALIQDLTEYISSHPLQRPVFLNMTTDDNGRSIILPNVGAFGQVAAKTKEVPDHLLVLGYSVLFGRTSENSGEDGTTCNPRWRLQSSEGHSFSKELVDLNTFAYTKPDCFWQAFPMPFLLPKGTSLAALIDVPAFIQDDNLGGAGGIANAVLDNTEKFDNHIIFRCVSV